MYLEKIWTWLGLLFWIVAVRIVRGKSDQKVVCYVETQANYRTEEKFLIEDIEPTFCTHLVYAYAGLDSNHQVVPLDPKLDLGVEEGGLDGYRRFNRLKENTPELKTLLAIGGFDEDSKKYSKMAFHEDTRKIFIDSVLKFLKKHGFNGLDVDWEYPAHKGGAPQDLDNFIFLLKELKESFKVYGYILSTSVSADRAIIDRAYDIPNVCGYTDFVNIKTYNFHGKSESQTGHNTPLQAVKSVVDFWIMNDCPSKSLNLGLASYGRSFSLSNSSNHGLRSPIVDAGEGEIMGYNQICKLIEDGGWTVIRDKEQEVPYAFKANHWVSYDDEESLEKKVDYLKEKGLGGAMIWSIDKDDFKAYCDFYHYHLLLSVNRFLRENKRN